MSLLFFLVIEHWVKWNCDRKCIWLISWRWNRMKSFETDEVYMRKECSKRKENLMQRCKAACSVNVSHSENQFFFINLLAVTWISSLILQKYRNDNGSVLKSFLWVIFNDKEMFLFRSYGKSRLTLWVFWTKLLRWENLYLFQSIQFEFPIFLSKNSHSNKAQYSYPQFSYGKSKIEWKRIGRAEYQKTSHHFAFSHHLCKMTKNFISSINIVFHLIYQCRTERSCYTSEMKGKMI